MNRDIESKQLQQFSKRASAAHKRNSKNLDEIGSCQAYDYGKVRYKKILSIK